MVADPLHRLDPQGGVDHPADVARVFHDVGRQAPDRALEQLVQLLALQGHGHRDLHALLGDRLQRSLEQAQGRPGHAPNVFEDDAVAHAGLVLVQGLGDVGDAHRLAADALEVVHGTGQGQHEAQVARDRLVHRVQARVGLERLDVEVADRAVIVDHLARLDDVAGGQGLGRQGDLVLYPPAHLQHQAAEPPEVPVEARQDVPRRRLAALFAHHHWPAAGRISRSGR